MNKQCAYDFINLLFDRVLVHLRWIFFPFFFLDKCFVLLKTSWRLMVNEYYKSRLASCGRGVRFNGKVIFTRPDAVRIGDNVHINNNAYIRSEGGLYIGDNVHISRNLTVYTRNHRYNGSLLPYDWENVEKPVSIGRNVWIGINVSISPGVSIGEGAIIGMGTVVTRDIPELAVIISGEPDRIKARDPDHYHEHDNAGAYGGMSGYPNRWL